MFPSIKRQLGRMVWVLMSACWAPSLLAQGAPDEFIRSISQSVLDDLKADRSLQTGDLERLNLLVERKVMPYVDFQRMTALAVGRNWRAASPEQQRLLMQEFRRLLLLTYSGAVRQVNDLTFQVRPVRTKPDDDEIVVRTQVLRPGREPIQIDYRMQKSSNSWKIFDLNIMGLWLVEHYRNQFAQIVGASGIDGLIQSLRDKNQTLAASAK
ncbi:MAG: phospholipid-binding protein MlaC [Betaproteobacteria bacterium]